MLPIQDQGATLKSVFNAFDYHCNDETKYPYFEHMINELRYKHVFEEAFKNAYPIVSYRQTLASKHAIKYILYKLQQPIIFGMSVHTNFLNITKENDILSVPTAKDELLGLHAVLIVGYDDETDTADILNSHGLDWGNDGYFRIKYEFLLDPDLSFEFYCINA